MAVNQDTGTPRRVYAMCRNSGYDAVSPDPLAANAPDLELPSPMPPDAYRMEVLSYVWLADAAPSGLGAGHRHWMPGPVTSLPSGSLALTESHFHNGFVNAAGQLRWSTERDAAIAPHDHESVSMRYVNSLGDELFILRPKWVFVLATIKPELFTHWRNNAVALQMVAEREWIGGVVAEPGTWQFQAKPSNVKWAAGYKNAINTFMLNTFGMPLPLHSPGGADIAVDNDRSLVRWWSAINSYELRDETRAG